MGLAPGHLGVGRTWHFSLPSVALPSLPPAAFRAPALPSAWVPGLMVPAGMIARRGLEGEPPALPPGSACSLDSAGQEAKTSPAPACSLPPCPPPQSQPGHGTGLGPDLLAIRTTEQEGGPEREGPGPARHSGRPRPPGLRVGTRAGESGPVWTP